MIFVISGVNVHTECLLRGTLLLGNLYDCLQLSRSLKHDLWPSHHTCLISPTTSYFYQWLWEFYEIKVASSKS